MAIRSRVGMELLMKPREPAWRAIGGARPATPTPTYAEDFSLLLRIRRLRIARGKIQVLS